MPITRSRRNIPELYAYRHKSADKKKGLGYRYPAAALKAHHLYNAAIDTELLDEALEALGMLKGLTKFVNIEKRRLDAGVSVDFADSD